MLNTIKLNQENDLVQVAKYLSNYSKKNEATKLFDEDFKNFIIDWQEEHNLEADGIIGKNTWTALGKNAPTCSTSKQKNSAYVCAIQILLGGITVDGKFGSATKQAVTAYQSAQGLVADGIVGQKTWTAFIQNKASSGSTTSTGQTVTGNKVLNNCVKYLQWDSKWKSIKYSTHTSAQTIGNSGCGPAAMAMIMATFIDSKITPVEMCALAVQKGYRTYDNGTDWGFFKYVFKNTEGFTKYIETASVTTLKAALREGALAVCSMNSNDNHFWTSGGHFITARGCDDTYIYANDPNKSETPRKQASSKFQNCLKQAFIFWPIVEEVKTPEPVIEEPVVEEPVKESEPSDDIVIGDTRFDINPTGKIIDISKWQGKIDFKALKPEVAFVIARASCGSDKDVKIDEYAKAMIENRIPFAVYCYSYAGDEAKARDEAKKLVQYSEQYDPLFYIMDAEEAKITTKAIKAFADELRQNTCERIGCYVAHHRYNQYKYDTLKDLFDMTWIPCYGKNDGTIAGSREPSYECDLWQYTSTGKIAGINGNVDMNVIYGKKSLEWFLTNYEEVIENDNDDDII